MHARRLYAHRGAAAERPENTMEAFQRAAEIGVDALEMDVHLTRDGELIVAHDDTAARMCGAPLPWAELDFAETQRLDAGWGFLAADGTRPFCGQGVRIPRFADVLAAFPELRVNVDLKGDSVRTMLEIVRKAGAEERVTLASFQARTLLAARRRGYAGETGLSRTEIATLLALPALMWRSLPFTGTAAQVPTHQGPLRFDRPAFVAKCHSLGLRVDYWTIDDVAEGERLLALGADGIITNDPARMKPLFE